MIFNCAFGSVGRAIRSGFAAKGVRCVGAFVVAGEDLLGVRLHEQLGFYQDQGVGVSAAQLIYLLAYFVNHWLAYTLYPVASCRPNRLARL